MSSSSRRRINASPTPAPIACEPKTNAPTSRQIAVAFALLCALVFLTYSNHFHNSFQFDDAYAVQQNPYIQDLHNVPLFFKDARTNDALPSNQTYRPLLSVSFAIDYWLGNKLDPFWFHISTFFWYLVQLGLMFFFFRKLFDAALPDPRNAWIALFATALYGLHPAMAETVNYVMQRADLYSTVAVLAGLLLYIFAPDLRRYGVYLVPVIIGLFAKQPTAVFPALLFGWVWLFDEDGFKRAALRCVPAFAVTGAFAYFVLRMNAATYDPGGSAFSYRISQPAVLLSYFRRFFFPVDLSADTDRKPYVSLLNENVLYGFLFVLAVCAAIFWLRKKRETRPIAYGLFWFLVTCIPTSFVALAEVENDHRLFFPFVGLTMGVCWAAALLLYSRPLPRAVVAGVAGVLLASAAWGAHERNNVWHTSESLWFDVTQKSPTNGRGLMNYGLTQMAVGRYAVALDCFTRALVFNPNYSVLEINLGVVNGALHNDAEAERHFLRATQLAPSDSEARMFYGRWLSGAGRIREATANAAAAVALKPDYLEARHLLMQLYASQGDRENLRVQAEQTLAIYPADTVSRDWLARAPTVNATALAAPVDTSAESYLNESMALYQAGRFQESITAARAALKIKPDYAGAWNNIAASFNSLSDWDQAIEAGEKSVALDPTSQLARNNLAWAKSHKALAGGKQSGGKLSGGKP